MVVIPTSGPLAGRSLGQLKSELEERGFHYLTSARLTYFINRAYFELASLYPWPFLESYIALPTPLEIPDLGTILSVTNDTNGAPLYRADRRTISPYLAHPTTGTAGYYYLEGNTIKTYPQSSTDVVNVRYIAQPSPLSDDNDLTAVPDRWCDILVDLAVVRGYKDEDKFDLVVPLRQEIDRQVQQMMVHLLGRQYDDTATILTGPPYDA